jgi:hypothetical protein
MREAVHPTDTTWLSTIQPLLLLLLLLTAGLFAAKTAVLRSTFVTPLLLL